MTSRPNRDRSLAALPRTARALLGLTALLCAWLPETARAQIAIPIAPAGAYSQNFDGIGTSATATLPSNWKAGKDAANLRTVGTYATAVGATEQRAGSNMSSTATNGIYNYAAGDPLVATDRAVGFISSGSATKSGNLYAYLHNGNGGALSGLTISYGVERYRGGSNGAGFSIQLYYSTDGSTWTSAGPSFLTSFPADTGNTGFGTAPGATVTVSSQTLTALIPDGSDLYLAWNYSVTSGTTTSNAQGLGIDDVSILGVAATSPTPPTGSGSANPASVAPGGTSTLTVNVTPGGLPTSTGLAVTCDLSTIGGSAAQPLTAAGNNFTYATYLPTVGVNPLPWSRTIPCGITDAQGRSGSASIALTIAPAGPLHIHDVQGASHISPYNGYPATITLQPAIVTAMNANGFWMEEPPAAWDTNDATSEGVYVYTGATPTGHVGDSVTVTGKVQEYRPGSDVNRLTITEVTSPSIAVNSSGNPLPPAIVIGAGGRVPPSTVIEDDAAGNVETSGIFNPAHEGMDFWESLEGMLVRIDNAVAVSASFASGTNRTIPVVPDDASSSVRTPRGGIVLRDVPRDYNPEIIALYSELASLPDVNVGDHFTTSVTGIIDSYDGYELKVTSPLTSVPAGLLPESTTAAGSNELAIATFNVNNLSPNDPPGKLTGLASVIVGNLKSPDVIAVEEVQDNNGTGAGGVVAADQTWSLLIAAIQAAGGPTYDYRQIDPVYNLEGGASNGNIRTGFLFRTDRGLAFVDRSCGGCSLSTTTTTVVTDGTGVHLDHSPGRVDPTNTAWSAPSKSRPPLAGEFTFKGSRFFVIGNHWVSKGADPGLWSPLQPLALVSEPQRINQARVVKAFVSSILAADPNADVVVLGDLNDFQFSPPLLALKGAILTDLIETLPENQRYTYVYGGNSQALDHILLSGHASTRPRSYQVVHVNSEFGVQTSDHDPQVARLVISPSTTLTVPTPDHRETTVTVTGGGPGCTFTNASWASIGSSPQAPPPGTDFPYGLLSFSVTGCTPGATMTVALTMPANLPAGTVYLTYGPTSGQGPHWYALPASVVGTTITFSVADGGGGDGDFGVLDGGIVHLGGPTAGQVAADVPALDHRGLAALAAILAAAGTALLWSSKAGA